MFAGLGLRFTMNAITPSIFEQCYFFISAQDFALPSTIKSENRPCRGSSKNYLMSFELDYISFQILLCMLLLFHK